ncbi:hypothetical protein SKAU_G00212320 [Synaphobranchus kaupii]|uniref:Uncharacterized protein n=1 Tax=Synaphobranchus kaupii TaxID=118154 RepID=A0A9Q1F992_SYNKA|nr:hypothetical protein SKAU_G00212320 [Synaphobranchus kaupii]
MKDWPSQCWKKRKVLSKLLDLEDQLKELRGQKAVPFSLQRMDSIQEFLEMEDRLEDDPGHKDKLVNLPTSGPPSAETPGWTHPHHPLTHSRTLPPPET